MLTPLSAIWGVSIFCVEPGTVIENTDRNGVTKSLTVDEHTAVCKGNRIYLTKNHYEALKEQVPERSTV